jgi:uncharacterized protein (TIGR03118 family)
MKQIFVKKGNLYWVIAFALFAATGCQKNIEQPVSNSTDATSQSNAANERRLKGNFQQVNIVSNDARMNPMTIDPTLVNAWGLAFDSSGSAFVNSSLFNECVTYNVATGTYVKPPIPFNTLFCWCDQAFWDFPTGIALFNKSNVPIGSNDFVLPNGRSATGIIVGEYGLIMETGGFLVRDPFNGNFNSPLNYAGVTIADDGAPFIYAANFGAKTIDVFDGNWHQVNNKPFKDPLIPSDYAPFNIQNINNNLFVMYAKPAPGGALNVQAGSGSGFVDVFKPDGTLLTSFAQGGVLNAPWGCAMAPASWTKMHWDGDSSYNDNGTKKHFNKVQSVILIANHGDGYINAFNQDGQFLGRLRSAKNTAISIDGLRALSFAPATATTIDPNLLFFTAGPNGGQHGLFGYLAAQ